MSRGIPVFVWTDVDVSSGSVWIQLRRTFVMEFQKLVAIDWSGAKSSGRKIQVAEYDPASNQVSLLNPTGGINWTRNRVWAEFLGENANDGGVLIGFDFAFAYPYCDACPYCDMGAYFPGHPQTPGSVAALWAKVDEICHPAPNFYGGPFYLQQDALFADYLLYQTYTGHRYQRRFRQTDQACQNAGLGNISSVFQCVGAVVGVGSIAGMRLLHRIASENAAQVWPFCGKPASRGTTVVEIYPARFLNCAGVHNPGIAVDKQVKDALKHYGVVLSANSKNQDFTEDERDALVSVAGMKWWLSQKGISAWSVADQSCVMYEGWIFGI